MMKKSLCAALILLLFFTGCQEKTSGTLDPTHLVKTESELDSVPIVYEAPSLEKGLESLPFKIKLPEKLPFDAMPLKMMSIEDFKHDGKELRVEFMSVSKNAADKILLDISIHNFKVEYAEPAGDDVKLTDGVLGNYIGNSLIFEKDGIYYSISYNNENLSEEELKKQIIEMANQML
jgi:hypothetical protein